MSVGRFILHRFNGEEEYVIQSASIIAIQEEDGVRLWFGAETNGVRIRGLPDTAELHAHPKAEVAVTLKELNPNELVGKRFSVPLAYDDEVATIYYVEHDDLNDNIVEVVAQHGNVFHVRWTGTTTDANYYDGGKPKTKVEIEGDFTFKDLQKWLPAPQTSPPPSKFVVGERVRVVLSRRNRTPHMGTIRSIIWHHKDQRYNYYLEENGKKIAKRYLEEDLEAVPENG